MKSWENNGKRDVHKRFDLSQLEADMLHGKAEACGMNEAQYIRELICASQPTEAPPKEFYLACNAINKVGVNINQIAKVANSTGEVSQADIEFLREASADISQKLLEIRKIVSRPRYFAVSYFDQYAYACRQARKEGRPIPELGDELEPQREEKLSIDHPERFYMPVKDEATAPETGTDENDISGQILMSDFNGENNDDTEG